MATQKQRVFPLRLSEEIYEKLRTLAYLNHIPIAQIIRIAVEEKIKQSKKVLTDGDIAI